MPNRLSLTSSPSTIARRRGPELWTIRPHMASYMFSRQSPIANPPAITRAATLTHIGISMPAMLASHPSTKRSRCMRATISKDNNCRDREWLCHLECHFRRRAYDHHLARPTSMATWVVPGPPHETRLRERGWRGLSQDAPLSQIAFSASQAARQTGGSRAPQARPRDNQETAGPARVFLSRDQEYHQERISRTVS